MFFGLHTTKKSERDLLLAREGELIEISPKDFHYGSHKTIVCEEGTDLYYEHKIDEFLELLLSLDNGTYDPESSAYYKKWKYKGTEIETRLRNLPKLYNDIKNNGIQTPIHCEQTGERLDGSFRTKIAIHLGIDKVKAVLHKFKWQDIDEDFIERKLKAHELSSGKDYYEFEYGYKDWKNIPKAGDVYKENASRSELLKELVVGSVLDIGCNEGYNSIQLALAGHTVRGIDHDHTHNAYLNKLIFEWINKKDLPVEFYDMKAQDVEVKEDTVLMLNVLYHLPRADQITLLKKCKGKRIIFQCNLRKEHVRDEYYTSHPEDLKELLKSLGFKIIKEIEWKDKPIIVV